MADKIRLPSSEGGLVRYYDQQHAGKYVLKPEIIIWFCLAVIILGIVLSIYGPGWFGY